MIEFIWTTSDNLISKTIRWGLDEDCSHFAIRFGDIVFQSYKGRVREDSYWDFAKNNKILHRIRPRSIPDTVVSAIHTKLRSIIGNSKYDFLAIYYWAWRGILKKFFNRPIPRINLWGSRSHYYCVEVVLPIKKELKQYFGLDLEGMDVEMLSPHMFYELLKDSKYVRNIRG